ncbi:DUF6708 domain-containing protein [Pseudomonas guariconensis]|uniref:DUF6708 domain-containing protein n=1 Tax=Pseudomonas guariconensis TaxID=1288410 RepID=UPI002E2310D4
MSRPLLIPPCIGWKEDLPPPCEVPNLEAALGDQTPNHQDSVYLEIPRNLHLLRDLKLLLVLPVLYTTIYIPGMIIDSFRTDDLESILLGVPTLLIGIWSIAFGLRISLCPPRDEPIRFNRARNKIYAYNFKFPWWNPFGKWYVHTVSYDWPNVRAERWAQGSGVKRGVMLSIVEPGTHNVIDRFSLTLMGADQYAWSYICVYMQDGPETLPPPNPPRDHNDVLWCEITKRLAPKVEWPAEIDRESRTAP